MRSIVFVIREEGNGRQLFVFVRLARVKTSEKGEQGRWGRGKSIFVGVGRGLSREEASWRSFW